MKLKKNTLSRREFLKGLGSAFAGSALSNVMEKGLIGPVPRPGEMLLTPGRSVVSKWGTQRIAYRIGNEGMAVGGGMRVQFPKSWHPSKNNPPVPGTFVDAFPEGVAEPCSCCLHPDDILRPHTGDGDGQDYLVTATVNRPGASLQLSVANESVDGLRNDNLDWTVEIMLQGVPLERGDLIVYRFGDKSTGGRGVLAGKNAETEFVRIALDLTNSGFTEVDPLLLEKKANRASKYFLYAPSNLQVGENFDLVFTALDSKGNLASPNEDIEFSFYSPQYVTGLPDGFTLTPQDSGLVIFENLSFSQSGIHQITAINQHPDEFDRAVGNPISVTNTAPVKRIFWGDIHNHTDSSRDARGVQDSAFSYARDVARLDFFATTDHSFEDGFEYDDAEWALNKQLLNQYHQNGAFITLLGYEWTIWTPYGHHHIIFPDLNKPKLTAFDFPTLNDLWAELQNLGIERALTIPHHTGEKWGAGKSAPNAAVDWSFANDQYQRLVEVYSNHGWCEYYDPAFPLSYEQWGNHISVDGPHYVRDAWAAGQKLGITASSDDHSATPGLSHFGLVGVYADELSRDGIFNALYDRHTYATTGERILLEFRVDGHLMGEEIAVSLPHTPQINISIHGTDDLEFVEFVKFEGGAYNVIFNTTEIESTSFEYTHQDTSFTQGAFYYVRLKQVNEIRGRIVMAWSSPVWLEITP